MTAKDEFNRQVRRTAFLTVGLLAALIFGIVVLAGGDWMPGTLIVAASLIGLASQVPVPRRTIPPLARHLGDDERASAPRRRTARTGIARKRNARPVTRPPAGRN